MINCQNQLFETFIMKNLALSTLFIILSSIFISCSDDEIKVIESDSSIENEKKFESFRKEFATKYSESTVEISRNLENYNQSSLDSKRTSTNELTFNDFVREIPDSENLTNEAIILLEPAFQYANENQNIEELVDSFGSDELYSLAILFDSWENENLTEEQALNKLLYIVDNDFGSKSDCKFFCKVWNGIKAAARWVWNHRKEIKDTATTLKTIVDIARLIF